MKHKRFLVFQLIIFIIMSFLLYAPHLSDGLILLLVPLIFLLIPIQLLLIQKYYGYRKTWLTLLVWIAILGLLIKYLLLNEVLTGCREGGGVLPLTLSSMYLLTTLLIQYSTKRLLTKMLLLFALFIAFPISFADCSSWDFFCPCPRGVHWLWLDLKAHDKKVSSHQRVEKDAAKREAEREQRIQKLSHSCDPGWVFVNNHCEQR